MKENDELLQALQMRVSKLEAQTRRWTVFSVLMVLAGVFLVIALVRASRLGTATPTVIRAKTVEAQDFVLKDEDGRVRARLGSFSITREDTAETTIQGKVYHFQVPREPALKLFSGNGGVVWDEPRQTMFEQIK
jgi:hypothetical protein